MQPDHSNIPSSYELCFHARSRLNRCQNKRSGFSSSTGFLTVRLTSGTNDFPLRTNISAISTAWTPASFPSSRTEAYPSGPPIFCVVSIILCCVSVILCCVSTILCCVSTTLCSVSIILCCVSTTLCCVSIILC